MAPNHHRTAGVATVAAAVIVGALTGAAEGPVPPAAKRVEKLALVHGDRRVDEYAWLRDKGNPEVVRHLEAENAYTAAVMKPTDAFQESLYQEMLGRIKQTDLSVPYRRGEFFYYSRTEEGKQYQISCRKKGSLDSPEEILIDGNERASGHGFWSLGAWAVSDDGRTMAFAEDLTGFRQYTLHVKDLSTGRFSPERRERVTSLAWAADNRTLFYTTEDATTKRSNRLYRAQVGEATDRLLYEEPDERFSVAVERSRSLTYLFLGIGSLTTSEARVLRADRPAGEFETIAPRQKDVEYDVDHRDDLFYIRVNDTGRNFRLVTAPVTSPGREHWKEVLAHRADVMLEGVLLFRDHIVRAERESALTQLTVGDLRTGAEHRIAFDEPVYTAFPSNNPEFDTATFRYAYQSFVSPAAVLDYDMNTRRKTLLKETEVLGKYDRGRYTSERVHATASDGTKIPISLVRRTDVKRDGTAPLYLSGYGSYGIPLFVSFSSNRLSLLDRGVVVAYAHIRGGGDLGKAWHDAGRMLNKRNTFTDFIAAADFLVESRYGSRDRLVIEGGSAGGLLIGAVVNMRPDLARAAVLQVPFVDVINTMLDESLPLTVAEFEEWGNPKHDAEYAYMKTYCPYTNLSAKAYPAMLVKTSFNDSQVMYWEPAKYVARLRTLKSDATPLIFKVNMGAGHGGASGRYDRLREIAFDYAFMLWQMGIGPSGQAPAPPSGGSRP